MEVVIVLGWLVWTGINLAIAQEKKRSVGGIVVLSILLSPFAGYLYILAVPAKNVEDKK